MKSPKCSPYQIYGTVYLLVLHVFSTTINNADGHRILLPVTSSFHFPSHVKLISTMARALVKNGHHVTMLRNNGWRNFDRNGSASEVIIYNGCFKTVNESEEYNNWLSKQFTVFGGNGFWEMAEQIQELKNGFYRCCNDFFHDEQTLNRLKTDHFDLVLVFYLSSCNGLIATYLDIPYVVVTSTVRIPGLDETVFGMPMPSSYVSYDVFSTRTDSMGFFDRLGNLFSFAVDTVANLVFLSSMTPIQDEFDIKPDLNQKELFSGALLWLTHIDVTLDYARPFTPNVIPIGGILTNPPKPLPQDLAKFVKNSGDNGVVICSLGSAVRSLAEEQTIIMLKTFNKLKQSVLWKYEGVLPDIPVGDNVRIVPWIPQNDLLAHEQVKVLIYHGGMNGVYEAVYHGMPMVLLPLFADQFFTSTRIQDKGMGLMLRVPDITEEIFQTTIETVISDPSFKKNAARLSAIYHDLNKVQSPMERAMYWINHVLLYGGDHLRPRSADMGTIELYMLDVILFLIVVAVMLTVFVCMVLKKCCGSCSRCSRKENESKSKKKD